MHPIIPGHGPVRLIILTGILSLNPFQRLSPSYSTTYIVGRPSRRAQLALVVGFAPRAQNPELTPVSSAVVIEKLRCPVAGVGAAWPPVVVAGCVRSSRVGHI